MPRFRVLCFIILLRFHTTIAFSPDFTMLYHMPRLPPLLAITLHSNAPPIHLLAGAAVVIEI